MPRTSRRLAVPLLALGAVLGFGRPVRAQPIDPKVRADLVEKIHGWFDQEEDSWKGRKGLAVAVKAVKDGGTDLLKEVDELQAALYAGRWFKADYADKDWQKQNDITVFDTEAPYVSLRSERMRFTYALPTDYPKKQDYKKPKPPNPLLFVLHDAEDDKGGPKDHAGLVTLKRRYPKAEYPAVYAHWLMLAPAAARARFLEEDGTIKATATSEVFSDFWKRYHVDFDRVVLDGGDAAMAMASAWPLYFAGLVLRSGKVDAELVPNFAPVPVFVFDEKMEKDLKAAGHPDVTRGGAAELNAWLAQISGARKRPLPAKFTWTAKTTDQTQAYWVGLVQETTVANRTLSVEADRATNTVKIEAKGIPQVTLYLNDKLVDLDKEVSVVLNGHPAKAHKLTRDLDRLLDEEPIRIRKSGYLGWLFPTLLPLDVPAPATGAGASPGGPPGDQKPADPPAKVEADPAAEQNAKTYFEKAKALEEEGRLAEARSRYMKVCEQGETTFKIPAESKIKEIDEKLRAQDTK